jgi:hypothetical protein
MCIDDDILFASAINDLVDLMHTHKYMCVNPVAIIPDSN